MIRILVVDDHFMVRRGITELIKKIKNISSVDEAKNGKEALKKISINIYDIVLLDVSMPGENGLEILKQIDRHNSKVAVIMLSMYSDEHYVARAIKAGASGYLSKDNSPDELEHAIITVSKGKQYFSSDIKKTLLYKTIMVKGDATHSGLSNREFQVMTMIASGMNVTTIANELNLSVKTISSHRAHILNKMKMKNNSQITHYAIKEGLIK